MPIKFFLGTCIDYGSIPFHDTLNSIPSATDHLDDVNRTLTTSTASSVINSATTLLLILFFPLWCSIKIIPHYH